MRNNKIAIAFIVLMSFWQQVSFACSYVCGLPTQLSPGLHIGEGVITGYKGNFTHPGVVGEFGVLEITVTNMAHPSTHPDRIYLSEFGISPSCEKLGMSRDSMAKYYPLGDTIAFIASVSDCAQDGMILLETHPCERIFQGSMQNRTAYDYETHRRRDATIDSMYHELRRNLDKEFKVEIIDLATGLPVQADNYVPEQYQVYLDLVKLYTTNSMELRYDILSQLIWSNFVNDTDFIEKQNITRKQKAELMSEFEAIQEEYRQG